RETRRLRDARADAERKRGGLDRVCGQARDEGKRECGIESGSTWPYERNPWVHGRGTGFGGLQGQFEFVDCGRRVYKGGRRQVREGAGVVRQGVGLRLPLPRLDQADGKQILATWTNSQLKMWICSGSACLFEWILMCR